MKTLSRIAAVATAVVLGLGGAVIVADSASAHTAYLAGTALCSTDGTGSATTTWTLSNDYPDTAEVTASTDTSVIPIGSTVAPKPANSSNTFTAFSGSIAAPAAGKTQTITVSVIWRADGHTQTGIQATTNKVPNNCSASTPSLNASVTGVATCNIATQSYSILWTGTVTGVFPGYTAERVKYTGTPGATILDGQTPGTSFTYTTTAQGSATSASAPFHVHVTQAAAGVNPLDADATGSVNLGGTCLVVDQTCTSFTTVGTTDLSNWSLTETRSHGHNYLVPSGLHVYTDGSTDVTAGVNQDKAAGYHAADFPLSQVGSPSITWTGTSPQPGGQLMTDLNNDGVVDGFLVFEPAYGGDTLWLSNNYTGIDLSNAPTSINGGGTGKGGTINQWLAVFPNAHVKGIGYSLGSGVAGNGVISVITAGCVNYTFGIPAQPTATPGHYSDAPVCSASNDGSGTITTHYTLTAQVWSESDQKYIDGSVSADPAHPDTTIAAPLGTCPVTITPCDTVTAQPESTNLDAQGWTFVNGEFKTDGLELTSSNWDDSYAAHAESFKLSDAGPLAVDGGIAIIFETNVGNIHYEPYYSLPLWTNTPGILPASAGGQGGNYAGNLSDLLSNPTVTNVYVYYGSGSATPVTSVLKSASFNCTSQTWGNVTTTTVVVNKLASTGVAIAPYLLIMWLLLAAGAALLVVARKKATK